jgi:hypothetical protein
MFFREIIFNDRAGNSLIYEERIKGIEPWCLAQHHKLKLAGEEKNC